MSAFLLETKSTAFAARNRIIHGQENAEGLPGGSDTDAAIQEALDYAYASFDREWAAWACAQES